MVARRSKTVTVLGRYQDTITHDADTGHWRNPARADRVIAFIECLTIPSGVGAGSPFKLREWQRAFLRDVYEPCDEFGRRMVRDAVLSMGRKNGKTALIAALVLVHSVGPEAIENGEIYSAANDREQAAVVFKFAAQFVRADTDLERLLTVVDSTKRIVCRGNGSFYRALSREAGTKHGLNPSVAIYDELAQSRDRELYDTINTAFGARDEPLFIVISTQSRDPQHILSELIDRGLTGTDPTVVCHLYAMDDDADPFDEEQWYAANPALGDFLSLDYVRKMARQAKDSPSFEPSFRNLTCNQRVDLIPSLVSGADWRACHDDGAALQDGEEIYLGLDLSATTDLCALVAVSARNGDRIDGWFWKPRELLALHETRDRAPYERWVTEGHLIAAHGRDIDYDLVAHKIAELSVTYRILGIAFDRWRMATLMKCFARLSIATYYDGADDDDTDGIRFVEWGQGFKDMAPAVDALDKAIASRSLAHRGHPVLTWCFSNAVAVSDPAGNRKLDKSKARFRIDGAVATVMALGLKARDMIEDDDDLDGWLSDVVSVG
jgi:phage terminase large subunit-like protein